MKEEQTKSFSVVIAVLIILATLSFFITLICSVDTPNFIKETVFID